MGYSLGFCTLLIKSDSDAQSVSRASCPDHPFHCWAVLKVTPEESDGSHTTDENRLKSEKYEQELSPFLTRFDENLTVIPVPFLLITPWFKAGLGYSVQNRSEHGRSAERAGITPFGQLHRGFTWGWRQVFTVNS